MKVLIVGGTGVISTGIVKALLGRGAEITLYNRGKTREPPPGVELIVGDRADRTAFERTFAGSRYDVVIDMIGFTPEDAESSVRAFSGRCEQLQFCSTACVYSPEIARTVLVDETFPLEPVTEYGRNKVACERLLGAAAANGAFALTIVRPSQTYGPGGPLIDQLEFKAVAWDRIERGLPVLCAGDGLGLWQATHRDDVGKLFAYAALNQKTYGEAYNATRDDEVLTWRAYYRAVGKALGARAKLVFMPAQWFAHRAPARFGFLTEITQFHGAYTSAKAKADVPEFRTEIDFETGAKEMTTYAKRHEGLTPSKDDHEYQRLVDDALALGLTPVPA